MPNMRLGITLESGLILQMELGQPGALHVKRDEDPESPSLYTVALTPNDVDELRQLLAAIS